MARTSALALFAAGATLGAACAPPESSPTTFAASQPAAEIPVAPVPSRIVHVDGLPYRTWQTPGDAFRIVCPEPCALDEQAILAEHAAFKVGKERLVRLLGVDVLPELAPVDVHLGRDAVCARRSGEIGLADVGPDGRGFICLHLADGSDGGAGFRPDALAHVAQQGLALHEWAHVVFFGRHVESYEAFVQAASRFVTSDNDAYRDACSPEVGAVAPLVRALCRDNGFSFADLAPTLIALDALYRRGLGDTDLGASHRSTSVRQMRAILDGRLGRDAGPAFAQAGFAAAAGGMPNGDDRAWACGHGATLEGSAIDAPLLAFAGGSAFTPTWRVRNTGGCAWPEGTRLEPVGGERMHGPGHVALRAAAPGEAIDVAVPLTTPETVGVHVTAWRLTDARHEAFGPVLSLAMVVRPRCAAAPVATRLEASPASVAPGGMSVLAWGPVTGAEAAALAPSVGPAALAGGDAVVAPATTTTYELDARCGELEATSTAVVAVDASAPRFAVTAVTTDAAVTSTSCPARIELRARLSANGASAIEYMWERSDGARSQPQRVVFEAAGSQTVTTTWQSSSPGAASARLRVLAPVAVDSEPAAFEVSCGR